MAKQTQLSKVYQALKSGKRTTREAVAKSLGVNPSGTQTFLKNLVRLGLKIDVEMDGRSHTHYTLIDVKQMGDMVAAGTRLSRAAITAPAQVAAKKDAKPASAKTAGKVEKRVTKEPKTVKTVKGVKGKAITNKELDTSPLFADKRDTPATELAENKKAAVLDADMSITEITEREFDDIKESLGIDFNDL